MRNDLRAIAQASQYDPKKALTAVIGNGIDEFVPFHNLVVVATYIGSEKTKGGIILTDRALSENRFQGKCGLVLKVGPTAFKDAPGVSFGGMKVEPGEWVVVRPSDGLEMFMGGAGTHEGASVRLFEDIHIKGRVSDPTVIY